MSRPCDRLRWRGLALVVLLWGSMPAVAQTQDIEEHRVGGIGPTITGREIWKLLDSQVETKDLQQPLPLKDVLRFLEEKLSDEGKKYIRIIVRHGAFKKDDAEAPDVGSTEVKFPPFPRRMSLATALRLTLSKIPTNNAVYRIRAGQVQITTRADAAAAPLYETVYGSYRNRPLSDALKAFAEQSGVTIVVDRRVSKQVKMPLRAHLGDRPDIGAPLVATLRLITDMAGLRYLVLGNVVYVTSSANARALRARRPPLAVSEQTVEGEFRNRPLVEVLGKLAQEANLSILIDGRVTARARVPVTARFLNDVPVETALRVLTDMADLSYAVVGGIIYVTSPANAEKLRKEERRKNPGHPKAPGE